MTSESNEPSPDAIIAGIHAIRAKLLAEYDGDIVALTDAARARQNEGGIPVVSRATESSPRGPKAVIKCGKIQLLPKYDVFAKSMRHDSITTSKRFVAMPARKKRRADTRWCRCRRVR